MIGGGLFGIFITVAALKDPNYEGSVSLFLPTIICGVIGMFIGSAIDKGMKK
jgi:hypothetical protein